MNDFLAAVCILIALSVVSTRSVASSKGAPPLQVANVSTSWALYAEWSGAVPPSVSWELKPALSLPAGDTMFLLGGSVTATNGLITLQCSSPGQTRKAYTTLSYSIRVNWKIAPGDQCRISIQNEESRGFLETSFSLIAIPNPNA